MPAVHDLLRSNVNEQVRAPTPESNRRRVDAPTEAASSKFDSVALFLAELASEGFANGSAEIGLCPDRRGRGWKGGKGREWVEEKEGMFAFP